jgi:hypothetical protein
VEVTETHVIALSVDGASNVSQLACRCLATLCLGGIQEAFVFSIPFVLLSLPAWQRKRSVSCNTSPFPVTNGQCKKTKNWLEAVDIPQQMEKEPIWHIKERVKEGGCGCLNGFADERF